MGPRPSLKGTFAFGNPQSPRRVLFLVDGLAATFDISFLQPLRTSLLKGEIYIFGFTQACVGDYESRGCESSLLAEMVALDPQCVVFSRYGGRLAEEIVELFRGRGARVVFHLDDNLFALPSDLGRAYHDRHLSEEILGTRRYLAREADLVYCSTLPLERLMREKFPGIRTVTGIYCAYPGPLPASTFQASRVMGYMGTKSHLRDLKCALDGVMEFLRRERDWRFELLGNWGDISLPDDVKGRVNVVSGSPDYSRFREILRDRRWEVGILPLVEDQFNEVKAPTKFVEYTAAGMVCLATPYGPYRDPVAAGAAIGVENGEWARIHGQLSGQIRLDEIFARARTYCAENFALNKLTLQVQGVLFA